jgi:hypothetical protein
MVAASNIRTMPAAPPVATQLPSGVTAMAFAERLRRSPDVPIACPVEAFHILGRPSLIVASQLLSGAITSALTRP